MQALVVFGHRFCQHPRHYGSLLAGLRAAGHEVVAPTLRCSPVPRHRTYAAALARAAEGHRGPVVLMGHSMGGGCALLAASRRTPAAVVTLAAAPTWPRASAVAAPVLFVVGAEDAVVPPARTRRLHDAQPRAEWAVVEGGSHCGFMDSVALGGLGCDRGTIAPAEQVARTLGLVDAFLRRHLA